MLAASAQESFLLQPIMLCLQPPALVSTCLAKKTNLDSPNSVPDHAYALATKPSPGDLEKLLKKEEDLKEPIGFFEDLIDKYVSPPNDFEGVDWICTKPKYSVFCKDGVVDINQNSAFMNGYKQYLKQKQELAEIALLKEGETVIQTLAGFRTELIKEAFKFCKTRYLC
mgnify:CR=1 FL=1